MGLKMEDRRFNRMMDLLAMIGGLLIWIWIIRLVTNLLA
jgi:hypothetical protein